MGAALVPPAGQVLQYDLDGNLTNDGLWFYVWDAENRLKAIENLTNLPQGARRHLEFTYDFLGRRVRKQVFAWNGSGYSATPILSEHFVHDRGKWNLLGQVNASNNAVVRNYVWGQDLSDTFSGAGGVGGLVMQVDCFPSIVCHFPVHDGNGNVAALLGASDSTVSAHYEYGPFGETVRMSGLQAKANPFRLSTKFTDSETDLVNYGGRYYFASLGRWGSRDSIGEGGGINLYVYAQNNCPNMLEASGASAKPLITIGEYLPEIMANLASRFNQNTFSSLERVRRFNDLVEAGHEVGQLLAAGAAEGIHLSAEVLHVAREGIHLSFGAESAAQSLVDNAADYYRHVMNGDSAMADLDAIGIATSLMELSGDYVLAYSVLDVLLQ